MAVYLETQVAAQVDPRVTELHAFAASEGIKLPLHAELIVWFEERGCIVNLLTGKVTLPTREEIETTVYMHTPSGKAVSYLLQPRQDICDARELGEMDRQDGLPYQPQHYLFDEVATREYRQGYGEAVPTLSDAQMQAELEDLREARADEDFWRTGC